jgi:hypothetical protein
MDDATDNLARDRKRRWVRFSLLGVSVAGMLLACWVGYHLNWIRERHNAKVGFCYGQISLVQPDGTEKLVIQTWDAPWPLRWFGEKGQHFLMAPDSTPKEEIDRILALFPEAEGKIDLRAREDVDPSFRR